MGPTGAAAPTLRRRPASLATVGVTVTISASQLAQDARAVRRLVRALVRDPALADDVGQDASLALLRGPTPAAEARRSWLATVVRNAVRLRLRATARRPR